MSSVRKQRMQGFEKPKQRAASHGAPLTDGRPPGRSRTTYKSQCCATLGRVVVGNEKVVYVRHNSCVCAHAKGRAARGGQGEPYAKGLFPGSLVLITVSLVKDTERLSPPPRPESEGNRWLGVNEGRRHQTCRLTPRGYFLGVCAHTSE